MAGVVSTTGLSAVLARSVDLKWAVTGWVFFVAENAVLSENRAYLISRLGDEQYHAVYGTFSTLAAGSIGYGYYKLRRQQQGVLKSATQRALQHRIPMSRLGISWTLLTLGLNMASQAAPKLQIPLSLQQEEESRPSVGLETHHPKKEDATTTTTTTGGKWKVQVRCPFDFADSKDPRGKEEDVRGTERITRHPGLWTLAITAAGQAFLVPAGPLQVWFAGPTLVAWLGGQHMDSRFRRGMGGRMSPHYEAQTSNVPFGAILTGRQQHGLQHLLHEWKPLNGVLATLVSTAWVLSRARRFGL